MISFCQKIMGFDGSTTKHEICRVCGGDGCPVKPLDATLKPTYTDHHSSRASSSNVLCDACVDVMGGRAPNTLRMVSTMWSPENPQEIDVARFEHLAKRIAKGAWIGNKKDCRPILKALLGEIKGEWGVGFAESGQLHVAPFVRLNHGAKPWVVRLDRADVESSPAEFRMIFLRVNNLISQGFTRSSIEDGNPKVHELVKFGVDFWRQNTTEKWANSPLLSLALGVSKKEHADEAISRLDG